MSSYVWDGTNKVWVKWAGDANGVGTVSVTGTVPLPTGAATAAKQLADGHNVTVDNASGAAAVNIQDGGNTITVDGAVTATVDTSLLATHAKQLADGHNVAISQTVDGTANAVVSKLYNPLTADYRPARADGSSSALQTIDYAHHTIHNGNHYFVVGVQTLANNNVLDFTWVMPNTTKWVHWMWKLDTSGEVDWYVYEGAVITNALANTITPFNSHRNSLNVSDTVMKYELQASLVAADADTDVTGATLLKSGISGSGRTIGGGDSRDSEVILKQNTIYCMRAVAKSAGYIDFDMEWYEHTNLA